MSGSANGIFDLARDEFLKQSQSKFVSQTPISIDGNPGGEVRASTSGGESRVRFYLIDGRLYQVLITRFFETSNSEEEIQRFFNSFKVVSRSNPTARASAKPRPSSRDSGQKAHVSSAATTAYNARMQPSSYTLSPSSFKLLEQFQYYADGRLQLMTDLDDRNQDPGYPDTARHFSRMDAKHL